MQNEMITLLHQQKEKILQSWRVQMLMSDVDPLQEQIIENTATLFDILVSCFAEPEIDFSTTLKEIASKIAKEKVSVGMHLNEFIKRINGLKNELFLLIDQTSDNVFTKEILTKNYDLFLHFTVTAYINLKIDLGIKEKQQLTEAHKERLTMLGQMTSTFVHEIRNPLTSIKGFIQLLKADHPDLKYLDIISEEINQLNERLSQFLKFSKKEQEELSPIKYSLKELIKEVETFLYPSFVYKNVQIETNIDSTIYIAVHREEVRQVLLNILLNALDELTKTNHPHITIDGRKTAAGTIEIILANNGPKINPELLDDIFKPFITTKQSGTGIGLFVCKEIIEKNHGTLSCTSTDEITAFTITLPIV